MQSLFSSHSLFLLSHPSPPTHSSFSPILLLPLTLPSLPSFSHSLFLLAHPSPPTHSSFSPILLLPLTLPSLPSFSSLFPPPQSTTRRNHINASRAKNQSLLLNIIPSYVASYYLRKGANSQVGRYACMYMCNWQVLSILHSVVLTAHALTSAICAPPLSRPLTFFQPPSHSSNLPLTLPTTLSLFQPPSHSSNLPLTLPTSLSLFQPPSHSPDLPPSHPPTLPFPPSHRTYSVKTTVMLQ